MLDCLCRRRLDKFCFWAILEVPNLIASHFFPKRSISFNNLAERFHVFLATSVYTYIILAQGNFVFFFLISNINLVSTRIFILSSLVLQVVVDDQFSLYQ
jgi:hypothetical protein